MEGEGCEVQGGGSELVRSHCLGEKARRCRTLSAGETRIQFSVYRDAGGDPPHPPPIAMYGPSKLSLPSHRPSPPLPPPHGSNQPNNQQQGSKRKGTTILSNEPAARETGIPPANHLPNAEQTTTTATSQVVFADGQTESVFSLPIVHDLNDPDEGCEVVVVGVTAVTGTGASIVSDGGIHDVSTEAVVRLEEDDFTSAVRETVEPEGLDVDGGGLSPAAAEVLIAYCGSGSRVQMPDSTACFRSVGRTRNYPGWSLRQHGSCCYCWCAICVESLKLLSLR